MTLIKSLLGDSDEQVQKALAWALRSWAQVDLDGLAELLRHETATAVATDDGHRAWVLRDALPATPALGAELRPRLAGVRRRADAPSTSAAGLTARAFIAGGGLDGLTGRVAGMQGERQQASRTR